MCEARWFCFSVCCMGDVSVEGWCEFSFTRKLKNIQNLLQHKLLWKILEKVFITNKSTQCEIWCTLKIDVFKITDNRNIGKFISKYKLLFLDQAISNSDPSQILIVQYPIPRVCLPPSPPLSNFYSTETPLQHNPYVHVLLRFPYFVLPHSIARHYKSGRYQIICQSKPIKFNIKLYTDHNALWVKHATHQIVGSLRAVSLSKLDNTVNNNSIFNTKYGGFSTKKVGAASFSQPYLCIQTP